MHIKTPARLLLTALTIACFAGPFAFMQAASAFSVIGGGGTPPPPITSTSNAKVTGGGYIPVAGGEASFGFVAMTKDDGTARGNVTYQDHATGRMIKSTEIDVVNVVGTHAIILGKAMTDDGNEYNFEVDVDDNAEPGAGIDTFTMHLGTTANADGSVTGDIYSAGGTLDGGNIQVHS